MWTARLKALSTWLLALTSGTALAVAAAVVTSGSLASSSNSGVAAPTTLAPSTTPTTDLSAPHSRPTTTPAKEPREHRETADHVRPNSPTTVATYHGYDDDENEQHWGESDDHEWGDD